MKIYYSSKYNDTGIRFDTTRKATAIAADLLARPIDGIELVAPASADTPTLERAHTPDYIEAIRTGYPEYLATSNGLGWDRHLYAAVTASTGGVVAAATDAYRNRRTAGSLSSGLHHARRGEGLGFCTFNGLAVAALDLLDQGARRVLILDLDAHCGGGTAKIIDGTPGIEQVDISVVPFDAYQDGWNVKLEVVDADGYLPAVETALGAIHDPASIDVILYNAGMDPHEDAGGVAGVSTEMLRDRERLVFRWAASHGVPIAWVLAGGYTGYQMPIERLVGLHRLTIAAAVRAELAAQKP